MFEFWNEMLVSNIRCKICWKAWVRERFTQILGREGWEINDLSPLSWQFFWNFMTFGWFQRLRVLKRIFVSRKLKYLNLGIMKCSSFLNLVFRKRRFIAENWLCFRACNSRIITYEQEFCLVVWFCVLITLRNLFPWKVFFETTLSWFLEMFGFQIMVLSKTCVRFRNRIFKRFE